MLHWMAPTTDPQRLMVILVGATWLLAILAVLMLR